MALARNHGLVCGYQCIDAERIVDDASGEDESSGVAGYILSSAARGDRAAWLHDVRTALEHNGIGWAIRDYSGSFGVVTKTKMGKRWRMRVCCGRWR
jgi:hypothetical protein